jgi:FkbM family methyltransferase
MKPNVADFMLKKVFQVNLLSELVLRNLDLQFIRRYLGREFLSPIQVFALDGYDTRLYTDLNVNSDGIIVVLGGFLGDSAEKYFLSTGCDIQVYEPVNEFFNILKIRFDSNKKIQLHNCAVSKSSSTIELVLNGEKSGVFEEGAERIRVKSRDIIDIVDDLHFIELLELNIEGAEYEILERLIQGDRISCVNVLQIQFHNLSKSHELFRAQLRIELSKTHRQVFSYDWVWERWISIQGEQI